MSGAARPGASPALAELLPDAAALAQRLEAVDYLADTGLATSMFLSLRLPQPLLLEGEAGVGKTEAAKALAAALGTPLVRLQCYEGIDAAEALYEWNYPRQLLRIRLAEAAGDELREENLFDREYLVRRRVPGAPPELAADVAAALRRLRASDVQKPPGIAEGIDWVAALAVLGAERLDEQSADATLGTVLKYREDQELAREQGLVGER